MTDWTADTLALLAAVERPTYTATAYTPADDPATQRILFPVRQHLETLHEGLDGWSEITCIHPQTHHVKTLWARCDIPVHLSTIALFAARYNQQGYGVYIAVCPRRTRLAEGRGKAEDAAWIPALWVDIDGAGSAETLRAFTPQPSIILSTGGGAHGYWLLHEPERPHEGHTAAMKGLKAALGGDPVWDFARIMRAMGSINTKLDRGGARVEVVTYNEMRRYSLSDFAHLAVVDRPAPRHIPPAASDDLPAWIADFLQTPPSQGERNNTLYRMAATLKDRGWSQGDAESVMQGFAGLNDREIENTIKSAYTRAPRGMVVRDRATLRRMARGSE